MNYRGIVS